MKKYIVNDKEINFFIDYVRVPKKFFRSNGYCGYNCDLEIFADKELNDYEREKLADLIQRLVNNYDKTFKLINKLKDSDSNE